MIGVEVLVVEQNPDVRAGITKLLEEAKLHVTAGTHQAARGMLRNVTFSVALIDIDTPNLDESVGLINALHVESPSTMIIAMTARRVFDDAVAAVRAGAIDVVLKAEESVPYLVERIRVAADKSVGKREVEVALADVSAAHEDFLQRFMDAERRAAELTDRLAGRDNSVVPVDTLSMLVVDEADSFFSELQGAKLGNRVALTHATSGGEALDRISNSTFHYALVAEGLHDLPTSTVIRTIRAQKPDTIVMLFVGPGEYGYINLVEQNGTRPVVKPFATTQDFVVRLDDLTEAWRAKAKERRFAQAFREKHFDFLRRFVDLRQKIERAMREGAG